MCLLFIAINDSKESHYKLVLVNVRDEYYKRPTRDAGPWDDGQIIGRK